MLDNWMKNTIFGAIIISLAVGDFFLYSGIIKMFFNNSTDYATLISGLLGFVGAIIGGALTLFGVRWTMNKENSDVIKTKIVKAKFVYTELANDMNTVNEKIKDLYNLGNINDKLEQIRFASKSLIDKAENFLLFSLEVDIDLYTNLKGLQYRSKEIYELINTFNRESQYTDQEIVEKLAIERNEFAKAFNNIFQIRTKLK